MSQDREALFRKMIQDFPQSPMGHFSLGKLLLEQKRYAEAATHFEHAARLQPDYAAALVSLGDAYSGAGDKAKAKEALQRARQHALSQNHTGLAEEIDGRIADL
jgi:uncharacterized protein HemY